MPLTDKTCVPCRGGTPPLTPDEAAAYQGQVPDWALTHDATRIERDFKFANFAAAMTFVNQVGDLAESEGLRPAYSCRSGICHTCSTKILSGDVDYVDPPLAEPEEGQALICCSYPGATTTSDDVLILDI